MTIALINLFLKRIAVYKKMNGRCAYCGCELEYKDMQVDHVIPINGCLEQGEDTLDNMLPACRSCNHYKSKSTLEGFRKMVENMPAVLMRDSVTYKNALVWSLLLHIQSNSILSSYSSKSAARRFG